MNFRKVVLVMVIIFVVSLGSSLFGYWFYTGGVYRNNIKAEEIRKVLDHRLTTVFQNNILGLGSIYSKLNLKKPFWFPPRVILVEESEAGRKFRYYAVVERVDYDQGLIEAETYGDGKRKIQINPGTLIHVQDVSFREGGVLKFEPGKVFVGGEIKTKKIFCQGDVIAVGATVPSSLDVADFELPTELIQVVVSQGC